MTKNRVFAPVPPSEAQSNLLLPTQPDLHRWEPGQAGANLQHPRILLVLSDRPPATSLPQVANRLQAANRIYEHQHHEASYAMSKPRPMGKLRTAAPPARCRQAGNTYYSPVPLAASKEAVPRMPGKHIKNFSGGLVGHKQQTNKAITYKDRKPRTFE